MNELIEIKSPFNRRMTNEEVRNLLDELLQKVNPNDGKSLELLPIGTTVEEAIKLIPRPGQLMGLSTGYSDIDKMTGGLGKGELSVWFGGTSVGKSQLTQNIALNMAISGVPVMMLPLEMGMYYNTQRLLQMNGEETAHEFLRLPIYYPDAKRMDIGTLANTVRDGVDKLGIRVVVVDQLQQLVPRQGGNLTEAISSTTDELHKIASENGVHIMLISHINRSSDQTGTPTLQDLKGSSSIEQDADMCISLYKNTDDEDPEKSPGYYAPLIATMMKNRNRGNVGSKAVFKFSPTMRLVQQSPLITR